MEKYPRNHFSYSAISAYLDCPMKWYYNYVVAPVREEEPFVFTLGTLYHNALETLYGNKDIQKGFDILNDGWAKANGKFEKKGVERIIKCYETYAADVYPLYESRTDIIEMTDRIDIEDIDVPFEFRIDLSTIDKAIIDHKTVGTTHSKYKPNVDNSLQLNLYAYGYYVKTGFMPSRVEYHYAFKDTGNIQIASAIVNQRDMLKAVAIAKGVYKAIKNDVFYPSFKASCRNCPHEQLCTSNLGRI